MFTPKVWKGGTYSIQELQTLKSYINPIDISSSTVQTNLQSLYTFNTDMLGNLQNYISTTGLDIFGVETEINNYSTQISDGYSTIAGLSSIIDSDKALLPNLEYQQQTALADYNTKHAVNSSIQSTFSGLTHLYSTTVTEYIDALSTYTSMSTIMSSQIISCYTGASSLMSTSTILGISDLYATYITIPSYELESTIIESKIAHDSQLISALQGHGTLETQPSISTIKAEVDAISSVTLALSTQIQISTIQIQHTNDRLNELSTIIAKYNASTIRYNTYNVSSLVQIGVLNAIYSENLYIKNSTTSAYKKASTFIVLNSTNTLIQTVTNLIQQKQNGANVSSAVLNLGLGMDLEMVYQTLKKLAAVQQAAYDTAMQGVFPQRAEVDIAAIYDAQIQEQILKYNTRIAQQMTSTAQLVEAQAYYSTLYLSSQTLQTDYDTNMRIYTSTYTGITSQITDKSNTVVSLTNQINSVDATYNSYNAYIQSYTSSLIATQNNLTDNIYTIANTKLQISDFSTVLGNISSGNYLNLSTMGGPMQIMYQNAIAFDKYSADLAGSLSSLYAYDYDNIMGMLNVISTQLIIDTVDKRQNIATNSITVLRTTGPLSTDITNAISTMSTGKTIINNFMPLFNQLYAYISSEYLNKIAYVSAKRTYEQQSYYKVVPPSTTSVVLTPDQYNRIEYIYDLLIQEINRIIDTKKVYVSTIFKPQLDYIVSNVAEEAQRLYLNSPTSYQINNVEYLISSILPLSISYIYVAARENVFLSESLIPTTTRNICVSSFSQAVNGPDVALRDTSVVAPTTTLDTRVCGVSGRYVQISKADNKLQISQIIVIDKTGKNVAFGKSVTILPSILQQVHADLAYITNGNYTATTQVFVSTESAIVPYSKVVTIDLGTVYDITAVKLLNFDTTYATDGIQINILDASRTQVASKALLQNLVDFTDNSNTSCPLDIKPLRYGACGVLARYVRIYPPSVPYNYIFSQIAVVDSNRSNIAVNAPVQLFANGTTTQVPGSLVNREYYQALPLSQCYISASVTDPGSYIQIDLGAERDVTAVHLYNTSDTNNSQIGLRVQLWTEDKLLAVEADALTNNRKEVIPFIGFNVDSNCSTELRWPAYYGAAGIITRYVRLMQTQLGGFGFSKVEIIDKNGRDIGTFKPVTATSNQATAYLAVSNRQNAVTADKCYVANLGPTLQSYIIDLQWEREICAINVYGCSDVRNLTNNINIDLFRQLGTPLVTRSLNGSQTLESFDFRTDPEESVYPTAVTTPATAYGPFGTMCDTVIIPFSVLATDPAAAVVESSGKNLFNPKNVSYSGGNTVVSFGYMADITSVTITYDATKISYHLQLTDCNNNTVADAALQPLSTQTMYADFRNPSTATYAPLQPLPTRYGTKGILAQYIRIIPRDNVTPLYVSQVIAVDSSGENLTIQADTFTPAVNANTAYAVDGIYEAKLTDTDWLQMFYSKYRQKVASSSFVSAGAQEQNYLLVDLGSTKEINSVIYVVSEGYNKTGQGVIVQLIDSNLSVVGVQLVSQLVSQFGVDILDFRLDRTESYFNPRAGLEITQRDPIMGRTNCGVLVKYIRIQQLTGSQPIQMSQVIAINSDGFNVALYKPTYSTSNNTASSRVIDGSYYMRTTDYGFISNATQGEYLEINLTEELEIVNVYVINLLTDPANNFANMKVILYNAKRDVVMVQTMPASLGAGLSTSNPALKSFNDYPQVTKIGVSVQSALMSIKSDIGLASAFANAGQSIPSIISQTNLVTNLTCASDLTSASRFTRGPANGIPTRKIRIYNPGQYIQISQIMAFTGDGTNVAMRKPCSATSVLPGLYVSRVTDGEEGYFHSARPESRSYVSGLKTYNYVEIDLETDYEIVGVKYIPPSTNYYRNVGLTIQLLSSDNVFLSQYLITPNTAAGVLIDFRYPIGVPQSISQLIAPHIGTYYSLQHLPLLQGGGQSGGGFHIEDDKLIVTQSGGLTTTGISAAAVGPVTVSATLVGSRGIGTYDYNVNAPTINTVVGGYGQLTVNFNTNPGNSIFNVSGISHIISYINTATNVSTSSTYTAATYITSGYSYTFNNVATGNYYTTIYANYPTGNGTYTWNAFNTNTQSSTAVDVQSPIPDAPTGTAVGGYGSVTLNWTVPSYTGGYGIRGYTLGSSTSLGGVVTAFATSSVSSYTINNLQEGTYYYSIQVTNANGISSAWSPFNAVSTLSYTPVAPTGSATSGNGTITLNWSPSSYTAGYPLLLYTIGYSTTSGGAFITTQTTTNTTYTFNNVASGTYYPSIQITNTNGAASNFAVFNSVTVVSGIPGVPTGTATGGYGVLSFTLTPPSNTGGYPITSYNVGYSATLGGAIISQQTISSNTYTFDILIEGTYYPTAQCTNSNGVSSAWGTINSVVVQSPVPGAPTGSATAGNGTITINFTAPSYTGGYPIISYTVSYGLSLGTTVITQATTSNTSYTFTNVATGLYFIKLLCGNSKGISSAEGTVNNVTVSQSSSLAVPVGTVTGSYAKFTVVFGGVSNASSYTIAYSATLGGAIISQQTTTMSTYTFNNVAGGKYYVYIQATSPSGVSAFANFGTVTVQTNVPDAPVATATGGFGNFRLNWTAPSYTGGSMINSYTVGYSATSGGTPIFSTTTTNTTYFFGSIAPGTYYPILQTNTSAGISSVLANIGSVLVQTTTPAAPTGTATGGYGTIKFDWTPPSYTGGSTISTYSVGYSTTSGGSITILSSTIGAANITYTASSRSAGTYYPVIKSKTSAGIESAWASLNTVLVLSSAPGAPVVGSAVAGSGTITLNWSDPAYTGGYPITKYSIWYSTTAGGAQIGLQVIASPINTYTYSGILAGTYYPSMRCQNSVNVSPTVSFNSVTVTNIPTNPTFANLTGLNGTITINWSPPPNTGGLSITSYTVGYSATSGGANIATATVTGTVTTYSFSGVQAGTYYATIKCTNSVNVISQTAYSSPIILTNTPSNPTISATGGNGSIMITWTPPTNTGGFPLLEYVVGYSTSSGGVPANQVSGVTGTSYTITNVPAGNYYASIQGKNTGGGVSAWVYSTKILVKFTSVNPIGIAEDSAGNMYYTDTYLGYVINLTAYTIVTTSLNYPAGLACDGTSLYVADYGNNAVKKIGGGATTTLPLTGIINPYAVYYNNGVVYCSEYKPAGRIFAYNIAAGTFQIFTQTFNYPSSIILNNSNIFYVSSAYDKKIYTLTSPLASATPYINSIALSSPSSLTYDASSNIIFLADYAQDKVYSIGTTTSVIAGTGTAGYSGDGAQGPLANLNKPVCIYYSRLKGCVFISDFQNNAIRYVNCYSGPPLKLQTTTTRPSYFTTTTLIQTDITVSSTPVTPVLNTNTYSILTNPSPIQTILSAPATIDSFVFYSYNNTIYYTSAFKLYSYNLTTLVTTTIGGSTTGYSGDGTRIYKFGTIKSLALNNNILYLGDYDYSVIRTLNLETGIISTFMGSSTGSKTDGQTPLNTFLTGPLGITWDNNGILYIIDNYTVRRINVTNRVETVVGTLGQQGSTQYTGNVQAKAISLSNPTSITFDQKNNLIVCDSGTGMIYTVNPELRMTPLCGSGSTPINKIIGSVLADSVQLINPQFIRYDNLGNLYVTSSGTHQILKIVQDPVFLTYLVSVVVGVGINTGGFNIADTYSQYASLNNPTIIQILATDSYYFLDYSNKMIRYVGPAAYNISPIPTTGILKYSPLLVLANSSGNTYNTTLTATTTSLLAIFTSSSFCADFAGNLYICNGTNILKLDTNNNITTLVGGFTSLTAISIYNNSMLFVSDNTSIKSVTLKGVIVTIASNLPDVKTNTIDLNTGCLFTMQPTSKNIFIYNIKNGSTGTITLTQTPYAIATDSIGNLFISTGDVIQKYPVIYGTTISLGAPITFTSGLGMCRAITYNTNLYYTSNSSYLIYSKFATDTDGATGQVISGIQNYKGPAINGTYSNTTTLYNPICLTFDANGSMFVLDTKPTSDSTIYKIPAYTLLINEMAYNITGSTSSTALKAGLSAPLTKYGKISGTCFGPDGSIYISDSLNNCVWKEDTTGIVTIYAGATATTSQLSGPTGIAMSADGILYICDTGNNRVMSLIRVNGVNMMSPFAGTGVAGTATVTALIATAAAIKAPTSIAFDGYSNIYISCSNQIYKVNTMGIINTYIGGGSSYPSQAAAPLNMKISPGQIAVNSSNELHFIETFRNQVVKLAADGTIQIIAGVGSLTPGFSYDGTVAVDATLSSLQGIVIDYNDFVYMVDNGLVRKLIRGAIQTVAGNLLALTASIAAAASAAASTAASTATTPTIPLTTLMTLSFFSPAPNNILYPVYGASLFDSIQNGNQWTSVNTTITATNKAIANRPSLYFDNTTGYFYNTTPFDMVLNFNMYWQSSNSAWSLRFTTYNFAGVLQSTITTATGNPQTINQQITLLANQYFIVAWANITKSYGTHTDVAIPVTITILPSAFLSFLLGPTTTTIPIATTTLNQSIIIPLTILNEVQNQNGLGQFPLQTTLQNPGQLAIDNNGRLLVTQQAAPQLMLIPFVNVASNSYVQPTLTYGVSNIRYVKIRGNGNYPVTIEISQIAVIASSYLNVAATATAYSNISSAANIVDKFYGSKSTTYKSGTSASEYVKVDLGANTDVVFVFVYLGLNNKTNNNGLLLDLLDSNNNIIQTRIIQNITNARYIQKISFDFRVSTMLSLNTIYQKYKLGPIIQYSKQMVQFIRINTGGLPILGISQIVIKSADDGSNLATTANIINPQASIYYSQSQALNILTSLLQFTFTQAYYVDDINACVEINLGQPYNISNIIIYSPPLIYGQTIQYTYTITTYGLDGLINTYPTLPTPSINTLTGPQYPVTTMKICDPVVGTQNVRYIEYRNTPGLFSLQCSQLIVIDKYGINVAYGKTVIIGTSIIINGIDNTQTTYYSGSANNTELIRIDLGSDYEVVLVKYWNAPTNINYANGTTIKLLDFNFNELNTYTLTGSASSEIADFRADANLVGLTYAQSALTDSYLTGATMARYIRVQNPGYNMQISQIAVYDIFGVNLAVGCPIRSTLANTYILVNNNIPLETPSFNPVTISYYSAATSTLVNGVINRNISDSIINGTQWNSSNISISNNSSNLFSDFSTGKFNNNTGLDLVLNFYMYWNSSNSAWSLTFKIYNSIGTLQNTITTTTGNPQTINQQIILPANQYFTISWSNITLSRGIHTDTPITITITIVPSATVPTTTSSATISSNTADYWEIDLGMTYPITTINIYASGTITQPVNSLYGINSYIPVTLTDNMYNNKNIIILPITLYDNTYRTIKNTYGMTPVSSFTYQPVAYDTVTLSGASNPTYQYITYNGSTYQYSSYDGSINTSKISTTGLIPMNKSFFFVIGQAPYINNASFTSTTGLFSSYFSSYSTDGICNNNTGLDLLVNITGSYYNNMVAVVNNSAINVSTPGVGKGSTPANIVIKIYSSSAQLISSLIVKPNDTNSNATHNYNINYSFVLTNNTYFTMELDMSSLWYIPYLYGTLLRSKHIFSNFKFNVYKYNSNYAAISYYSQQPTIANIITI